MKIFRLKIAIMICMAVFISASCNKKGAIGPKGDKGEPGPAGTEGQQGDPGNANVHVYTKDIMNMTWTTVGTPSNGYLQLEIPFPPFTQDVISNDIILVYVKTSDFNSSGWALLPYYTERNIRVQAEPRVDQLILKKDQDGEPYTQSWHSAVRVVVIEPSEAQELMYRMPKGTTGISYDELKAYYHLTD